MLPKSHGYKPMVMAMKKTLRKCKYEEKGVSPVIGVILMVAITVVLAASLYLMLPKANQEMNSTPPIMFNAHKLEGNNWTLDVVCDPRDTIVIKYSVFHKNGTPVVLGVQFPTNSSYEDANGITWMDLNNDGKLSTNDVIRINGDKIGLSSGDVFKTTAGVIGSIELPY